jgi:hypothetical protein
MDHVRTDSDDKGRLELAQHGNSNVAASSSSTAVSREPTEEIYLTTMRNIFLYATSDLVIRFQMCIFIYSYLSFR